MKKNLYQTCLIIVSICSLNSYTEERLTPVNLITAKTDQLRQMVPLTGSFSSNRAFQMTPKQK